MSGTNDLDSAAVDGEANARCYLKLGSDSAPVVTKSEDGAPAAMTLSVPGSTRRRCYGAAVEAALDDVLFGQSNPSSAPRLRELLSQLDADGHDTAALRMELDALMASSGTHELNRPFGRRLSHW